MLSLLLKYLITCVIHPCISDYAIWCFEVITGNLALTELAVSRKMIVGKSTSSSLSLKGLILLFCAICKWQALLPPLLYKLMSHDLQGTFCYYYYLQGECSSFYLGDLEQKNRKPEAVSNSFWAPRPPAHHRCPMILFAFMWHTRTSLQGGGRTLYLLQNLVLYLTKKISKTKQYSIIFAFYWDYRFSFLSGFEYSWLQNLSLLCTL